MPGALFFPLLIVLPSIVLMSAQSFWLTVLSVLAVLIANPIVFAIRKAAYFGSDEFRDHKARSAAFVEEHNEVAAYVREIRAMGSFELGASASGQFAHLASFENTSNWKYRRDRHVATYVPHVHNASLQVVRNASAEPIKYVMKYFGIRPEPAMLAQVQRVADDVSRLETAVRNVEAREAVISRTIDPPAFILKRYQAEFWDAIGVQLPSIDVPYPRYEFQYVSAGGNSSQRAGVTFDSPTLEVLSHKLAEKIRWTKSAAGQRALMTARLRNMIKARDGFACVQCGTSVDEEPNLLLEVDHIHPVSRGGLSVPENLQTLCWRCNRRKGARVD